MDNNRLYELGDTPYILAKKLKTLCGYRGATKDELHKLEHIANKYLIKDCAHCYYRDENIKRYPCNECICDRPMLPKWGPIPDKMNTKCETCKWKDTDENEFPCKDCMYNHLDFYEED